MKMYHTDSAVQPEWLVPCALIWVLLRRCTLQVKSHLSELDDIGVQQRAVVDDFPFDILVDLHGLQARVL